MLQVQDLLTKIVKQLIEEYYGIKEAEVLIEHPTNISWGDYSTNISLIISKSVKQNPMEIAKKLTYGLEALDPKFDFFEKKYSIFEEIYFASPGFINFRLSPKWLYYVLCSCVSENLDYGKGDSGNNQHILIEYSQPNPNKPQHIGHARNNFLGASLVNLFRFMGYKVTSANYVNDWGTHICKAMLMYQKYGDNKEPDIQADHFVGKFYAMYEQEEEKNPEIKNDLAEIFAKMEEGDTETLKLWKTIVNWTITGWEKTYKDQNITFDKWFFQNDFKNSGKEIVELALKEGVAEKDSTGAVIARLEKYGIPDKVLLRSDGSSVYSTQDLQMAKDTIDDTSIDKRIYVVDYRQSDYFNQIFKILEILGIENVSKLVHVPYGVVKLPEGNMSSRKGRVITADEVFSNLIDKERVEIKSSNRSISDKEDTIQNIAMAAFKYGMLKVDSSQDIIFDYSKVTKFEGNTGPYLQYTYARANSVLSSTKFGFDQNLCIYNLDRFTKNDFDEKEEDVIKALNKFPEIVRESVQKYSPHVLCNYLFEVAQKFNSFYASNTILVGNENIRHFRLMVTISTRTVLKSGLSLLGISTVDAM